MSIQQRNRSAELRKSLAAVVILVFSLVDVSTANAAEMDHDPVSQPTGPCEIVRCPPPSALHPEPRDIDMISVSFLGRNREKKASRSASVAPIDADLERLIQCQSVVDRYRPIPGGSLKPMLRDEYIRTCLRTQSELTPPRASQLRSVLARLSLDGVSLCTVSTLAPQVALAARHCLLGVTDAPGSKIESATLDRAELEGMDSNNEKWKVVGVQIIADPFMPGSELYDSSAVMRKNAPKLLDFVIIGPKSPDQRFGEDRSISVTLKSNAVLAKKDRLILSSMLNEDLQPRTDDFLSCQVTGLEDGYFLHHCQALPGSSGAPVFVGAGDGTVLRMIGMHIGQEGAIGPKSKETENEAVILPEFVVHEIASRLASN